MKRIGLFYAGLALFAGSVHAAAQQIPPKPLAKVHLERPEEVTQLIQLGVPVLEGLPTWAIAEVGSREENLLSGSGFRFEVLDIGFLPGDYYLVFSLGTAQFSQLRASARILTEENGVAVVKATKKQAEEIPELGFELKRVSRTPMKTPRPPTPQPSTLDTALIREMVDRVSENHVRWYVQDLQDFGTRFSYSPGCSLAADYLKQELDWLGLETEFHSYQIPNAIPIYDVHTPDGRQAWRVDEAGRVWHTSDGGANWTLQFTEPWAIPLFGVHFNDSLQGWACGAGGIILHTDDGGLSWTQQTLGEANYFWRIQFVDSLNGWAAGGDSGKVAFTTDGGATWSVQSGITELDLYGVSFVDENRGWVVGPEFDPAPVRGVILNTTNGGTTWTVQYEDSTYCLLGVDFPDSANGWAVGLDPGSASPRILHTTDGGSTWTPQSAPGWFLIDVDFLNPDTGWASGFGSIVHTETAGSTWVLQSPGVSEMLLGINFANPDSGWSAGTGAALLRSEDGGTSWNQQWVPIDTLTWKNVIGTLPGVLYPDSICIVCGHYDCTSEDPYYDAPGADDNASGTSLFMEAASVLSTYRFERTIKFIGFSGEEQGLWGSDAYAQQVAVNLNIIGALNFDMVGYLDDANWDLNIRYNSSSQSIADILYQAANQYTQLVAFEVYDTTPNSDHASFWNIGVPAICGIERAETQWNPYYHTSGDRIETLTLPFLTEVVKLGVAGAATIAVPYIVGTEESVSCRLPVTSYRLEQNSPNPFTTSTTIRYAVPLADNGQPTAVALSIYDTSGRLVRTLVDGKKKAGHYSVSWDGKDDAGREVAAGVCFYRLSAGQFISVKKMTILK